MLFESRYKREFCQKPCLSLDVTLCTEDEIGDLILLLVDGCWESPAAHVLFFAFDTPPKNIQGSRSMLRKGRAMLIPHIRVCLRGGSFRLKVGNFLGVPSASLQAVPSKALLNPLLFHITFPFFSCRVSSPKSTYLNLCRKHLYRFFSSFFVPAWHAFPLPHFTPGKSRALTKWCHS